MKKMKTFGRHVVADPLVCHGRLTYRGTRILVDGVLALLSEGRDWDDVVKQCHGRITRRVIAETIRIAGRVLEKHAGEVLEPAARR